MKKLTFQKSGICNGVLRIQGIDVVWSKKAMCYVARVLFEPKRESVCVENEIIGMRLYAETERAMEKALHDECRLHHCKEDLEVIIPDQENVS